MTPTKEPIQFAAWPDIGQFREVIREVKDRTAYAGKDKTGEPIYDRARPLPKLKFSGTVKLHGSNSCIVVRYDHTEKNFEVAYQSRTRLIAVQDDNAGFSAHFEKAFLTGLNPSQLLPVGWNTGVDREYRLFGEWCGGSIQKGVALNQLPRMFVLFGVQEDGEWLMPAEIATRFSEIPEYGIHNIYSIPSYEIEIDFAHPEIAQNKLIEITNAVEAECPWGKRFGVSGTGEGVVWRPLDPEWQSTRLYLKVKGEKHSISKVKTLAPVDIEKVNSINEFVAATVTPARCEWAIGKLRADGIAIIERKHLGNFIRAIYDDVKKEESDTAAGNGLDIDKLGSAISNAAKKWFFANEDKFDS